MDYFDYRKIKKFSFLCVPSKKLVNHAAEKYWNKMFFDRRLLEKFCPITPDANQDEEMMKEQGKVLCLKNYHESEWLDYFWQ